MDPLVIKATADFNTYNTRGTWGTAKGSENILWTKESPRSFEEGPSGSSKCATFVVARDIVSKVSTSLAISFTGTSRLLSTWYKAGSPPPPPSTYKILAGFEGREHLLESEDIKILSPDPAIEITRMRLKQQLLDIPFRNAGDWMWYIQRTDIPSGRIMASTRTRLELCFVFAQLCPHGPLEIPKNDPTILTQPNFEDIYSADLFRIFLPSQWELIDNQQKGVYNWYVQRVVEKIWDFGRPQNPDFPGRPMTRFDVSAGVSFYLSNKDEIPHNAFRPQYGGIFDIKRWIDCLHGYCNAADLAALAQLACSLVLTSDGKEILRPRWIVGVGNPTLGQHDFGFINPGALFGWPQFPQCNSRIWANGGLSTYSGDMSNRIPAPWHVWIEVTLPGDTVPKVIDPSQCLGNETLPPCGTLSREAYIKAKIDSAWPDPARLPRAHPNMQNVDAISYICDGWFGRSRIGVQGMNYGLF